MNQNQSESVAVIFKQFDLTLPKPEYKTAGAAALDLVARTTTIIPAGEVGYIPLNIALQLPEGYFAVLAARSSLHKRGLLLANGIGIGDYDFRGPQDEYQGAFLNFSKQAVTIEAGERLVQLLILHRQPVQLQFVPEFDISDPTTKNRGGFGTTGKK